MTRKQKNMLTTMLKGFNARLKEFDLPTYTYETDKYDYNSYSVVIYYHVFISIDLDQLIEWKNKHKLTLFLGSSNYIFLY